MDTNQQTRTLSQENPKDIDILFINSLKEQLYKHSPHQHILKRAFGTGPSDDIKAYISFLSVSKGNILIPMEKAYFLIACLFYNVERSAEDLNLKTEIEIPDVFGRMYPKSSDTTKNTISRLLSSDFDNQGAFVAQFVRLSRRALKELHSNESIDYLRLLKDLKNWDANDKKVKKSWALKIVKE